ncbi:MAG: exosortase-associated EpsI family protein [Candidatus Aureabacteria bacterium]|nr:exosortase-associated EpsI family protein [Candidatus Auribacterota bacterium]
MKQPKHWLVVLLLSIALSYAFLRTPPPKQDSEFISGLQIPLNIKTWHGQNISLSSLNLEDQRYQFINGYFSAAFFDENTQRELTFSVIDSDHFHHPKVCYKGAGYDLRELNWELEVKNHPLPVNTLFAWDKETGILTVYWICFNKKVVKLGRQITSRLFASLLNIKNTSLMVRVDMPAAEDNMNESRILIQQFLEGLYEKISSNNREYLFGEK